MTLQASQRTRLMIVASAILTLVLYGVPMLRLLAYPLLLLSTLVHEMGHGIAAMLVGGSFHKFVMYSDGSGVAFWSGNVGAFARAFVALGGLVGPAAVAGVGFWAGRRSQSARSVFYALGLFLGLCLILWVRGAFSWLFVGICAFFCFWIARSAQDETAQLILLFLSVQLAFSVFARGDYLFTATAMTADGPMPSDVAHMADALWLPYWFWGAFCAILSVFVVFWGLRASWR